MTSTELEELLVRAALEGESPHFARNSARLTIDWLRAASTSDEGAMEYGSPAVISRRRRLIRSAGLAPTSDAGEIAALATAIGLSADDEGSLVRLCWALRSPTGRLAFADRVPRFSHLAQAAAAIMRERPWPTSGVVSRPAPGQGWDVERRRR